MSIQKQLYRVKKGGDINREIELIFQFNGKKYSAYEGDTIASALLANGIFMTNRSFKYHRPRGVLTANSNEPNALFEVNEGAYFEPNTQSTTTLIEQGMVIRSQNAKPSINFDFMEINRLFSPILRAGFYYKTFMWGGLKGWMFYEKYIRKAAGLGNPVDKKNKVKRESFIKDNSFYQKQHLFTDVLVIGAGISGLNAAIKLARKNIKVIVVDENNQLGGRLCYSTDPLLHDETESLRREVYSNENIRVLTNTTILGSYDHGVFSGLQKHFTKVNSHHKNTRDNLNHGAKQTFYKILTKKVIYATGAWERSLLFSNNDLPGILLAEALQKYFVKYAVVPAKNIFIATTNDSVYPLAHLLSIQGYKVSVADLRDESSIGDSVKPLARNLDCYFSCKLLVARGWKKVKSIHFEVDNKIIKLKIDLLAVSSGFTPNISVQCHLGFKPSYIESLDALIMKDCLFDENLNNENKRDSFQVMSYNVGSAAGIWHNEDKEESVNRVIKAIMDNTSVQLDDLRKNSIYHQSQKVDINKNKNSFIDFQHDVTLSDLSLANLEGFTSVEHIKRYTTLGMATDQGKLSNMNALKVMSELQGIYTNKVGTTTYRPPFSPVSMGALVGTSIDLFTKPIRHLPTYQAQLQHNLVSAPVGLWLRPEYYPEKKYDKNENLQESYKREAAHVRRYAGITDVSTLGKITILGPDAQEFINRIYANGIKSLKIGKIRYAVMLREDGFPFDDGTVMKLKENEFLISTTTAYVDEVLRHLNYHMQVVWPELKVLVENVSEQWASIAIAGPESRNVLFELFEGDVDVSDEALPFMSFKDIDVDGVILRIARISFSGSLGYELMIASKYANALWNAILSAGEKFGIKPYGTEAMGALRIEKGFITHAEMDGRVNLHQMNMQNMLSLKKEDFVGRYYALNRLNDVSEMPQLIAFVGENSISFSPGYHILNENNFDQKIPSLGWITATCYSSVLDKFIALGYLVNGLDRIGDKVFIGSSLEQKYFEVEVSSLPLVTDEDLF